MRQRETSQHRREGRPQNPPVLDDDHYHHRLQQRRPPPARAQLPPQARPIAAAKLKRSRNFPPLAQPRQHRVYGLRLVLLPVAKKNATGLRRSRRLGKGAKLSRCHVGEVDYFFAVFFYSFLADFRLAMTDPRPRQAHALLDPDSSNALEVDIDHTRRRQQTWRMATHREGKTARRTFSGHQDQRSKDSVVRAVADQIQIPQQRARCLQGKVPTETARARPAFLQRLQRDFGCSQTLTRIRRIHVSIATTSATGSCTV